MDIHALSATFSHLPIDWIILGLFVTLVALFSLRAGTALAVSFALATPIALVIFQTVPTTAGISAVVDHVQTPLLQAILFCVLLAVLLVCINRSISGHFSQSALPLKALLVGVTAGIIATVVFLQVDAVQTLWRFNPQITAIFGAAYRFWWLIASYGILAFARS